MKGGERTAKRFATGTSVRKRLAEITNVAHSKFDSSTTDEKNNQTLQQLIKRHEELESLLEKQSKIIELRDSEAVKLRLTVQKLQKQNCALAQTNTQLLAELNASKERVKTMQHELLCNMSLLRVKKLDDDCSVKEEGADDVKKTQASDDLQAKEQGNVQAKRRCLRRQSSNFKPDKNSESLFEIEDVLLPITKQNHDDVSDACREPDRPPEKNEWRDEIVEEQVKRPLEEGVSDSSRASREGGTSDVEAVHRGTGGRPSRRAAEKVGSYKEKSLKIKVRRD